MKKILVILFMMLPCVLFAQKHIEFMGVELGGDLDETIQEFKSKGFVEDEYGRKDVGQGFWGKWWKFDKVHIHLYAPADIGKVAECSVSLETQLFYVEELISNLDDKYGSHSKNKTLINTELDWAVPEGNRIHMELYKSFVSIKYIDYPLNKQEEAKKKEANKDL